jgi:hypothetical protein
MNNILKRVVVVGTIVASTLVFAYVVRFTIWYYTFSLDGTMFGK